MHVKLGDKGGRPARVRVALRIHGLGEAKARALLESLRPDDKTAPPWLEIVERVENGDLVIEVSAREARLRSLKNTVDEIISFLYATLKTLEEVAKPKRTSL